MPRLVGVFVAVAVVLTGTTWAVISLVVTTGMARPVVARAEPTTTPGAPGVVLAFSKQVDLPNPFLLSAGGKYFLYLSTAFGDVTRSNVPVLSGKPGDWGPVSDAMPNVPTWALPASAGADTWAPDVVRLQDRYVMYVAPTLRDMAHTTHCIGVAVSRSPQGPFTPVGADPLICQTSLGGDIDARLFVDPHGPRGPSHPNYLVWKSDNNNLAGSGRTTIWAAPMSNSGLALAGAAVAIFRTDRAWEEPVIESPQMVEAPNGSDWLFFSGGGVFNSPHYAIGAVRCQGPLGRCQEVLPGPLISSNNQGSGPGEETVFVASDHSMWLLYNPWHTADPYATMRPVEAARLGWGARGPYVAEAGRFPLPPGP